MGGLPSNLSPFFATIQEHKYEILFIIQPFNYFEINFFLETLRFCHVYKMLLRPSIHSFTKICKPLVVYPF